MSRSNIPEAHLIRDGGWCPNSPILPLLIYRGTLHGSGEALAREFEAAFAQSGWPPAWRYTVFDYPHYHSTSHEVIGIFQGEADIRLGDTTGFTARLSAGDVMVIPAGVSHQRMWQTGDFQGVGAYPEGCEVDEQRISSNNRKNSEKRIASLEIPPDPLTGQSGPLPQIWGAHRDS